MRFRLKAELAGRTRVTRQARRQRLGTGAQALPSHLSRKDRASSGDWQASPGDAACKRPSPHRGYAASPVARDAMSASRETPTRIPRLAGLPASALHNGALERSRSAAPPDITATAGPNATIMAAPVAPEHPERSVSYPNARYQASSKPFTSPGSSASNVVFPTAPSAYAMAALVLPEIDDTRIMDSR